MTYFLKTPPAIDKVASSATFYRTHLGHQENATSLAIKLIRRAVAIEKVEFSGDVLAEGGPPSFGQSITYSRAATLRNITNGRRRSNIADEFLFRQGCSGAKRRNANGGSGGERHTLVTNARKERRV